MLVLLALSDPRISLAYEYVLGYGAIQLLNILLVIPKTPLRVADTPEHVVAESLDHHCQQSVCEVKVARLIDVGTTWVESWQVNCLVCVGSLAHQSQQRLRQVRPVLYEWNPNALAY